ncbi:MarR family winged helix-turn-helix transcriptional regulator [Xanthobacter sp. DSM 24535]|uniref:MarR family winged helix-turn-helix transcriptional regulator n=1 Tax=Roseixanthobacter psychrophilus TaxID=3119917 RepID=UPI003726DFD8
MVIAPDINTQNHSEAPEASGAAIEQFRRLATVRLFVLSHIATRAAEARYSRVAGLRLTEARMLLVLGIFGPSTLDRVLREMSLEKALASRSASSLVDRELIRRRPHGNDGRAVELSLTERGRSVFEKLYGAILGWNEEWLCVLEGAERTTFLNCIEKLICAARRKASEADEAQVVGAQL